MNLQKIEDQKPVKIINKKTKKKEDKDDNNQSPAGIQIVEKPEYTGKTQGGQKFMNRAQIY